MGLPKLPLHEDAAFWAAVNEIVALGVIPRCKHCGHLPSDHAPDEPHRCVWGDCKCTEYWETVWTAI